MKRNLVYILDALIILLCCVVIYSWYVTDRAMKRVEELEKQMNSIISKENRLDKLEKYIQDTKQAQNQFVQWYINIDDKIKQLEKDIGTVKGAGSIVSALKEAQAKMEEEVLLWKLDRTEWITVFDGKSLNGWEISGTWKVTDGNIVGGNPDGSGGHLILRKDIIGENMAITALCKRIAGNRTGGLMIRRSAAGGYIFGISDDSAYIGRYGNGFQRLGNCERKFSKDKWHKLTLKAVGSRILCYVNDKLILDARDETLKEGSCGLSLYRSSALYKDVKIKVLKDSETLTE